MALVELGLRLLLLVVAAERTHTCLLPGLADAMEWRASPAGRLSLTLLLLAAAASSLVATISAAAAAAALATV